jgi:hypothetical protein
LPGVSKPRPIADAHSRVSAVFAQTDLPHSVFRVYRVHVQFPRKSAAGSPAFTCRYSARYARDFPGITVPTNRIKAS